MHQQHSSRICPKCKRRILGDKWYCPHCGAALTKTSRPGKYSKQSHAHTKETLIIAMLCTLVVLLGISTFVLFFKAQKPSVTSLQETAAISDPVLMETTVETTEAPQTTTQETTESPTELTEYIQETMPTQVVTEATKPEEMMGTVLRSAGELNVRSGAGTNYSSIGRLNGGDTVTIYEQKDVNGTRWGNIGYGWVSMDYIVFGVDNSTDPEYDNTRGDKLSEFNGEWISVDGYWYMRITPSGSGVDIYAEYPYNTSEKSVWTMHGEYDEYTVIRYWDGICKDYNNGYETVKYTNGEGAVNFCESGIEWHDFNKGGYMTLVRIGAHTRPPEYSNNGDNSNQNNYNQQDNVTQIISHPWYDEFLSDIITYIVKSVGGSNQIGGDRWRCKMNITSIKDIGDGQYEVKANGTYNNDGVSISVIFEEGVIAFDFGWLGQPGDRYVILRKCNELVWSCNMD